MGSTTPKVWLVTGANSGLGLAIALAALRGGHRVIATARDVARAASEQPDVEKLGGTWLKLDVRSTETKDIVAGAVERAGGKIDVVVNNAGYSLVNALEDTSEEEIHDLVNTHLYGSIRVLKGVLPTMRAQKSGTIVNMGSLFGFVSNPGLTIYNCCKYALDGLSESLVADLGQAFNIRVLLLQPGFFRTSIIDKMAQPGTTSQHYKESTVGEVQAFGALLKEKPEMMVGDPAKLGRIVVELVEGTGFGEGLQGVLRIPIGVDAWDAFQGKMQKLRSDMDLTEKLAKSTDFDT